MFRRLGMLLALGLLGAAPAGATTITGSKLVYHLSATGAQQGFLGSSSDMSQPLGVFFNSNSETGDSGPLLGVTASDNPRISGVMFQPAEFSWAALSPNEAAKRYAYTPVSATPVTGSGGVADPFVQVTVMDAIVPAETGAPALPLFRLTQTATHVTGTTRVKLNYQITNLSAQSLQPSLTAAADLYLDGSDLGYSMVQGAPGARTLSGRNPSTGRVGGLLEQAGSTWDSYIAAFYYDMWVAVADPAAVLPNTVREDYVDNSLAVRWMPGALASGASVQRELEWRFAAPGPLGITPGDINKAVGTQHTVTLTARELSEEPVVDAVLRVQVLEGSANAGSSTRLVTDGTGQASFSWTGAQAGLDTLRVYRDLNDNGTQDTGEIQAEARINWINPTPPVARLVLAPAQQKPNSPVTLDASTSSDSDEDIVRYQFDTNGDGSYETDGVASPTVITQFETPGKRTLGVKVTDSLGNTDTATAVADVALQAPEVSFAVVGSAEAGEPVAFDAATSSDDGTIVDYAWDFDGDGQADAHGVQVSYVWDRPGVVSVTLTLTDNDGAQGSSNMQVTVSGPKFFEVKIKTGTLSARTLARGRATAGCSLNAAGSCELRLIASARLARRLGWRVKKPVVIARGRAEAPRRGPLQITLRPVAKVRRGLARGRWLPAQATLSALAQDTQERRTSALRGIRLER